MAVSRGKDFEAIVKRDFAKCKNFNILRLYDTTSGYAKICTPCDFIGYRFPIQYYIECKSIQGNTIRYVDIRQFNDLVATIPYKGIEAGIVIWFISHQKTFWVSAKYMQQHYSFGEKSININNLISINDSDEVIEIPCEIKRVYGNYDFEYLLNKMEAKYAR